MNIYTCDKISIMNSKKKNTTKIIIKIITIFFTLATILLLAFYFFELFGGEGKLTSFFQNFSNNHKALTYVLFLVLVPVINLIPGISSMFFISLGNLLFNDKTVLGLIIAFLMILSSVVLTSSLMFLIGKIGGRKAVEWILGRKESEKTKRMLTIGGKAALPAMYLLPFFPDDTLALVVGMTDMKYIYNLVCTIVFRGIGILIWCIIGTDFFDYKNFTIKQWLIYGSIALAAFLIVGYLSFLYYRHLRKKEEGIKYNLIKGIHVKRINKED